MIFLTKLGVINAGHRGKTRGKNENSCSTIKSKLRFAGIWHGKGYSIKYLLMWLLGERIRSEPSILEPPLSLK